MTPRWVRAGLVGGLATMWLGCQTTSEQAPPPSSPSRARPVPSSADAHPAGPTFDPLRRPSSEAYRLFLESELRIEDGDLLAAQRALKEATIHDPGSPYLRTRLGEVNLLVGNIQGAGRAASAALRLDPAYVPAWRLSAQAARADGDDEGAEESLRAALRHAPGDRDASVALAEMCIEQGRVDEAARIVEHWMETDPASIDGYLALARLFAERGDVARAHVYVGRALVRDDRSVDALELAVRLFHTEGDDAQALDAVRRLERERGDSPRMRHDLLAALWLAGRVDEARELMAAWFDDNPSADMALLAADALETAGATAEARHVLERHPQAGANDQVGARIARMAFHVGEFDVAAQKGCAFSDPDPRWGAYLEALCVRALVYSGQLDGARTRYDRAVATFPKSWRVLSAGLDLEAVSGTTVGVLEHVTRVREQSPLALDLLEIHLRALEHRGMVDDAGAVVDAVLAKRPHQPDVLMQKARHLERVGKAAAAAHIVVQLIERADRPSTEHLNFAAFTIADHDLGTGQPVEWARRALLRDPLSGYVIDTLGWALLRAGHVDEGATMLQRADRLSPDEPEILYHLAVAKKRQGHGQEAAQLWQRAKTLVLPTDPVRTKLSPDGPISLAPGGHR